MYLFEERERAITQFARDESSKTMEWNAFLSVAQRKKINTHDRSSSSEAKKENWNIFISQTISTGRANDRNTESITLTAIASIVSMISLRVHAQKSDHLEWTWVLGLFLAFLLVYHWYSQSFSGFRRSQVVVFSFSSLVCFLTKNRIKDCALRVDLSLRVFFSLLPKIYSIIRQASQSGSYWNSDLLLLRRVKPDWWYFVFHDDK